MCRKMLEAFLETHLGLSIEAIGRDTVDKAIRAHKAACGTLNDQDYLKTLQTSKKARGQLLERVVVPETWFFRHRKSFDFLTDYVTTQWQPGHASRALRVLTVPCSSGEEPYSVAMALTDGGMPASRMHMDAADISDALLLKAKTAVYGQESFRGPDLGFRDRYFKPVGDAYLLRSPIRDLVRFIKADMLDNQFLRNSADYDIVFCRNLLIYLNDVGRKQVFHAIERLLKSDGLIFVGHAEREIAVENGFVSICPPGVFACRRDRRKPNTVQVKTPPHPVPRQRKFEKAAIPARGDNTCAPPGPTPKKTALKDNQKENERVTEQSKLFDEVQKLADQGALSSARVLCREFLSEHPAHTQANFLMGLIHEALDEADCAQTFFNKTVYLDPSHHDALTHLAFIMEHQGDKDRASHLRQRARVYRKQGPGKHEGC